MSASELHERYLMRNLAAPRVTIVLQRAEDVQELVAPMSVSFKIKQCVEFVFIGKV